LKTVQVVIKDYHMRRKFSTLIAITWSPTLSKRETLCCQSLLSQYVYICLYSLLPLKNLMFSCSNRLGISTDASGDHGHGIEK